MASSLKLLLAALYALVISFSVLNIFVAASWSAFLNGYRPIFFSQAAQVLSRISGSHGGESEDSCFMVVAPCSVIEGYRLFGGACCLRHSLFFNMKNH
jgi:hypothetical protein